MYVQSKEFILNEFNNENPTCEHYYVNTKETALDIIHTINPNISKTPCKKSTGILKYIDDNNVDVCFIDDGKSIEYWYFSDKSTRKDKYTYTIIHYT